MTNMKKPRKTVKFLNYRDCEKFVSEKHGIPVPKGWWSFLVGATDIRNDSSFWMMMMPDDKRYASQPPEILEFLGAFREEFLDGPFWISW